MNNSTKFLIDCVLDNPLEVGKCTQEKLRKGSGRLAVELLMNQYILEIYELFQVSTYFSKFSFYLFSQLRVSKMNNNKIIEGGGVM